MSTNRAQKFEDEVVAIPEGVTVTLNKRMLGFVGPLGKTFKSFRSIPVDIIIAEGKITLKAAGTKKEGLCNFTHCAFNYQKHLRRLGCGIYNKDEDSLCTLPITVKVNGKTISVENFQGERAPRVTHIVGNTKVTPKGEDVVLTGEVWTDITQTAANIELKTKVKNKFTGSFWMASTYLKRRKGFRATPPCLSASIYPHHDT